MLQSVESWSVTNVVELNSLPTFQTPQYSDFNLLIANLEDFEISSVPLITQINRQFPQTPLLAIHSYSDDNFIKPMLEAGAAGYIRNGISEHALLEAVQKIAAGQQVIIADSTY